MQWIGLGILFFFWFIENGDEFYEAVKKRNIGVILFHLLILLPFFTIFYALVLAPFIELLWTEVDWSSWDGDDYEDDY